MSYYIIKTTCYSKREARFIARLLLDKKLAACVQISKIESFYHWNEQVQQDKEHLVVMKTKAKNYKEIEKLIIKNNSYEIPQLIAIPIQDADKKYLEWIDNNCI